MLGANLAILLVAGLVDPTLPKRHKRLRNFGGQDFERLVDHLGGYDEVVFTPNVLTEVSNLVVQGLVDPLRARVVLALKELIDGSIEVYASSKEAAARVEFLRLGLTDAGLISVLTDGETLLTDDEGLYVAAACEGRKVVIFAHLRAER